MILLVSKNPHLEYYCYIPPKIIFDKFYSRTVFVLFYKAECVKRTNPKEINLKTDKVGMDWLRKNDCN